MRQKNIVLTGGGTGGHVFPAVAMTEEFLRRGAKVTYIGSARGFESKIVPQKGIPFVTIHSGAVKNQEVYKIVSNIGKLIVGFFQSLWILWWLKPDAVIGVGGYVSVPVCVAAKTLGIPLYLQEQNVSVGIANRFLGRFAIKIFLGFEQAISAFPIGKSVVTGNPLRSEFQVSIGKYEVTPPRLLILGGSQGANAINAAIVAMLDRLHEAHPDLRITHQTGERDFETVRHAYEEIFPKNQFEVHSFIKEVFACYQKTSLVIARSGALTVSEILQVRRPVVFVPYPRRGQNDQTANANYLQGLGVAKTVEQGEDFVERLWQAILGCLDKAVLERMQGGFSKLRTTNALANICDQIGNGLP